MAYTVYYETGSLQRGTKRFHKHNFATKKAAVAKASTVSKKRSGSYITVSRGGVEIAECYKGSCKLRRR